MTTEVRFRRTKAGLLLVPVSVNGHGPFDFILDTGNCAVPFLFSQALARQFAIAASHEIQDAYAVGPEESKLAVGRVATVSIGGLTVEQAEVGLGDMLERVSAAAEMGIDGNIGYQFLKDYCITIDYERSVLRLAPGSASTGNTKEGVPFDAAPLRPLIIVPARVNETGPYAFFVDTGASATVISEDLASRLGLVNSAATRVVGGAGSSRGWKGQLESVQVGNARCEGVTTAVADFFPSLGQAVGTDLEGVIGYNFLNRFAVTIDYPGLRILFRPPSHDGTAVVPGLCEDRERCPARMHNPPTP